MRAQSLALTHPRIGQAEGKATLPTEAHLVITPAPSDHGSSASLDEGALPGRKRSFAEAIGGDEDSQSRHPAPVPQDFPHGSRGQHYQHGVCPPYLPPTHIPFSAQNFTTNPLRNVLPVMAQRPEPPQVQANPVTSSQARYVCHGCNTSTARYKPLLFIEMRTLNQPPGSQHHIYSGTQHPIPTRATSDEAASMDPAQLASNYGGYDGSQIIQRIMPQRMSPYSLTQWAHEQPVRGYECEEIAGSPFQESPALARNNVGGSSAWPSTSSAPSWQGT
jgi:hypothetical protein